MDNAQKAIMIGVGLFITILVVSIVLLVLNVGMSTTKATTAKLTAMTPELEQQLTTMYIGRSLTKDDCEYIIKQYRTKLKNYIFFGRNDSLGALSLIYQYDPDNLVSQSYIYKSTTENWYRATTYTYTPIYDASSEANLISNFLEAKTYKCYLVKEYNYSTVLGLILVEE